MASSGGRICSTVSATVRREIGGDGVGRSRKHFATMLGVGQYSSEVVPAGDGIAWLGNVDKRSSAVEGHAEGRNHGRSHA